MNLRISFERTGGIGGPAARRAYAVDADTLPADEAKELRDLVQAADFSALGARPTGEGASPARPDAYHYRLAVEGGGQRHTITVSDTDMPTALRPLVKWLTKRASPGSS
jgi:hypothetical protein